MSSAQRTLPFLLLSCLVPGLFYFRAVSCHSLAKLSPLIETSEEDNVSHIYVLDHTCGQCPPGFLPCALKCYQLLNVTVIHQKARDLCQQLHPKATLAVPRTRNENLCAAGLAQKRDVWLGITDEVEEGLFVGDDGRGVVGSSGLGHVWSSSQPNDSGGKLC